jgi:uncharacterized repeat protein (TIGR01451 family)
MQPTVFEDSAELVPAGTEFYYYVKLQNNTGTDSNDTVMLDVIIPEGFTYIANNNYPTECSYLGVYPSTGGVNDKVRCTFSPPFPGNSYKEINITVLAGEELGVFKSKATVIYDPDTNNANDLENTKTTVTESADVEYLSITPNNNPVVSGGVVTYTANITNNGPFGTTNIVAKHKIPAGLTFLRDGGDTPTPHDANWTCSQISEGGEDYIECKSSALARGDNETFQFQATVVAADGNITLVGGVSSNKDIVDVNLSNNVAQTNIDITRGTNLSLGKSVNPTTIIEGESATFKLRVKNEGVNKKCNVMQYLMKLERLYKVLISKIITYYRLKVVGHTKSNEVHIRCAIFFDEFLIIHKESPTLLLVSHAIKFTVVDTIFFCVLA